MATVYRLLSTVYCLLSTVYCLLSTVYCLPSTVYCLLAYGSSNLERLPQDQPGEHPDQGVPGDRIERVDLLQPAPRRVPDADPAEALVPALRPRGADLRDRERLRVREGALGDRVGGGLR